MYDFKIGDEVECEASAKNNQHPRYIGQADSGTSGLYLKGKIFQVNRIDILVKFTNNIFWGWPILGHTRYKSNQWSKPGYLRLSDTDVMIFKADSEECCRRCSRMKDVGHKCWWCGVI